jgi:DNA-binding transcriptional LysR family regulator
MSCFDKAMSSNHVIDPLRRIDLNLLLALDALTRERSVTQAAKRAGVTQSAMSHTLRRLRELFDDPLLVRGRGGMVLTPRAEALMVPLRSGLVSLARTLAEPQPFEPEQASRTFRIVSPDLFDALVLPTLLAMLTERAPSIDLAVVPRPARLAQSLETGDVDLAIHPVLLGPRPFDLGATLDAELQTRTLFRDSFQCFARKGHPAFEGRRLTVPRFTRLDHILVSPSGEGPGLVDRILDEQGLQRRIALRVPHFATALEVVAQSDLVLTAPAALRQLSAASSLMCRPVPFGVPEHAITMIWHPRFTEDPAHRWLRQRMVDVTQAVPSRPRKTRQKGQAARPPQS